MPTLNWIGKEAVIKHHKDVPFRLLEPVPNLGCGTENAGGGNDNLIIQGDNLHALKALLPRYARQVKCIYIDPPYNTGNEGWIYNDNVNSPEIRRWLGEVVGKEDETLDRHDRWLSMMYPRLVLLKQFLSEDGIIFVSIDDDEVHHLRGLLDEIFGVNRRLTTFVWRTDGNFDNQAKIKNCHEYVLAYAINPDRFPHPKVIDPSVGSGSKLNRAHIQNTIVKNGPKNPVSEVVLPIGFPASVPEARIPARTNAWPHYLNDAVVVDGRLVNQVTIKSGWSSKDILQNFIDSDFQLVPDSKGQRTRFVLTGTGAIESIKEREQASHVITVINGVGSTQSQSAALAEMGFIFPFPKPVDMVSYLVSMIEGNDFLVLDSFAGSGTTGHAVLKQNAEDGGSRKFILVEMKEDVAVEVTARRLSKVITGYPYTGTSSEELLREKITFSSLKKANEILERISSLEETEKERFTRIKKEVKNGELVVTGELDVKDILPGLGGGFQFCRLSAEPLFNADGEIREDVKFAQLAEFVWFSETGTGYKPKGKSPLLGIHQGRAIYLLYNGILGDKSVDGGNVLTGSVLDLLPKHDGGPRVIYAAACRLGTPRLHREGIVFKQTPYALEIAA